ncbi:MAG: DNA/RNA nuclease SfsA [Armatimonadetes bacterium]|nr:DNA/RNA nuclease SfsA [Armatimonadota bacterium]
MSDPPAPSPAPAGEGRGGGFRHSGLLAPEDPPPASPRSAGGGSATSGEGARLHARLRARPNRYLAEVDLAGRVVEAHVPNPGRMHELMLPGRAVQLVAVSGEHRKTAFDLVAVEHEGLWVCIDNRLGGRFARGLLEQHRLPELEPYERVEAEVRCGDSRIDFRLTGAGGVTWVEVKSCTLVVDGQGRFPDAPTLRGARHVRELAERVAGGEQAAVLWVIQRPDAVEIVPNDATDPDFGAALREAAAGGVQTLAITTEWVEGRLEERSQVPVRLPDPR